MSTLIQDLRSARQTDGAVGVLACAGLGFFMPLWPAVLPALLVLGVVGLVLHHRKAIRFNDRWSAGPALLIALLLFALHLLGMTWSVNMDYGFFDLGIKAPLAVLPLLYAVLPQGERSAWRAFQSTFILGCILAVLVCCAMVLWRLITLSDADAGQEVFGERFSLLVHPSYFALYLSFALVLFLLGQPERPSAWSFHVTNAVLCLGIVLCGSKIGWILLPVILLGVLFLRWKDSSLRRSLSMLLLISMLAVGALVALSAGVRERIVEAVSAVMDPTVDAEASTSSEVRKLAWDGALDVIHSGGAFGVGTGDVKDELMHAYARKGYTHMVERRINAHSQYLQMWAALGLPGLLLTVALVLWPLVVAWRRKSWMLVFLFALCGVNWSVESMLEVQAGVVFFAYFVFLFGMHELRGPVPEAKDPRT